MTIHSILGTGLAFFYLISMVYLIIKENIIIYKLVFLQIIITFIIMIIGHFLSFYYTKEISDLVEKMVF